MSLPGKSAATIDPFERARANTGPAAFAAGLLLFFGFFYLSVPSPDDWFSRAGLVFVYTLRVGGLAMVAIAVWSAIGHPPVLLADCMVSCLIGLLAIVTGIVMILDGGGIVQTLINVILGAMFIGAGLRSGRDYVEGMRVLGDNTNISEIDAVFGDEDEEERRMAVRPDADMARPPSPDLIEMTPKPKPQRSFDQRLTTRGGAHQAIDDVIKLPDPPGTGSLADLGNQSRRPGDEESEEEPGGRSSGALSDLGKKPHRRHDQ